MKLQTLKPAIPMLKAAPLVRPPVSEGRQERKSFYDSALWQATREAKLRRDPLCQCCAFEGVHTPGEHVDHWTPLAQGGHPTAASNLVTMCASHHSRKTHAEQHGLPYPTHVPSNDEQVTLA